MEENITEKNGFMRLALGAGMTAYGIAHLSRNNSSRSLGSFLVAAGAMKMAEGIFLYCPMKALINSNVKNAVDTSFEEFMDGDSLMQAFRATYENSNNTNKNNSNSSQSGNASASGQNIAESVAKAANGADSVMSAATKVANAMTESSNSGQQSKPSNNQQNKNKQNQTQKK